MGFLFNAWLTIPLVSMCILFVVYLNYQKVAEFFHQKTFGQREEILRLMDLMFVEVDQKRLTWTMFGCSYGLGALIFMLIWPNVLLGIFLGAVVTYLGWMIPPAIVKSLWESRCNRFVDQMVDGMTIMGNGIKSGLSVGQSLERVVENMKGPIAQEFSLVLSKTRLGMPLEEALLELGARIPRPDVQMFVTSVNILKETGGNLAETFTTIVLTVRERQKIEKKIQAMTTQGVWQGIIISLVPFFLLIILFVLDPAFVMPLFTTAVGILILCSVVFLQIIGGLMIRKIVKIRV